MSYDHRVEVTFHQERARLLRVQADSVRADAEARAHALEREAATHEQLGLHIHRLCTAGSDAERCHP